MCLALFRPQAHIACAMTKPKITKLPTAIKPADLARGWEIHFGLPCGSILTREQLLQRDHATDKWLADSQGADGFLDERTLPHGLLFMTVDTALKICLQTGHPDSDPMVVGWYWDSFSHLEITQGVHSTPEWDEIEDGESLFAEDERMNGFPCWNEDIYDRFEDHSRQGYMGLSINGPAPKYDLHQQLDQLKKNSLDLAEPQQSDMQDRDEQQWALYFHVCRVQQLLAGHRINPIA